VFAGAAISLTGWSAYIRETLRGTTKPNRVTYFMWSVAPMIATAAALTQGVTWAVLPVFMAGFCPLMVFTSSFVSREAYWTLGKFDYACGVFSALAMILWAITKQPNVAIVFAIISDGLAAVPTLLKAWSHPKTDTGLAYVLAFVSAATSFAAVHNWTFAECGFAIYLLVVNATLALSIYGR